MTEPIPGAPAPSSPAPAATAGTTVVAAAREDRPAAGAHRIGRLFAATIAIGTMVVIVAVAVLLMMTPLYMHGALDRAGSAGFLGVSKEYADEVSDATVRELLLGPGTFVDPPLSDGRIDFYDAAEASHLRDARAVLDGLLVLAGLSIVVLTVGYVRSRRQPRYWRAMSAGAGVLAVAFLVIGALFLVAFDAAFTLFHEIFFPGGNWAFDFATQRLVQLYPIPFWEEVTTVLGIVTIAVSAVVCWLTRRRARRLEAGTAG